MVDEETAEAWKKAVLAVPVVRGRRKVKVERADGTVDERDAADVVAALVKRHGLEAAVREGALPIEIQRRRAAGLPDLCATCGKALGMSYASLRIRSSDPKTWCCKACNARKVAACIGQDIRDKRARKASRASAKRRRSLRIESATKAWATRRAKASS